jgi:hypothetical protein
MIVFMISDVPALIRSWAIGATMELMKSQVKGHFVLGSGVDCSPLSAGVSNISSNSFAVSWSEGPTWRT